MNERALERAARIDQLRDEIAARVGGPVDLLARYDEEDQPILVAADVDPEILDECIRDHVPVWPEPEPDPIDAMAEAVKVARPDAVAQMAALLDHLTPILRDLRERRR